jgi:hypothetical protein
MNDESGKPWLAKIAVKALQEILNLPESAKDCNKERYVPIKQKKNVRLWLEMVVKQGFQKRMWLKRYSTRARRATVIITSFGRARWICCRRAVTRYSVTIAINAMAERNWMIF